jgi:hypothetical protein
MINRFIDNWDINDYFSQSKCDKPAFSYSVAKTLYQKSPKHAYLEHRKLGNQPRERSKSMDIGQSVHTAILGHGEKFIKSEFDEFRTKEAKAWRDEQEENGLIVLKPDEFDKIDLIKSNFEAQMRDCGLYGVFESSKKELMAEYLFDDIYTISMFDAFNEEYGVIFDLKTTTDASPDACQRKIIDMGYDIQAALYTKSVEIIKPELTGRVRFIFLFQEVDPPYIMTPIELDVVFKAVGESKVNRSANIWRDCLATGQWPGYTQDIIVMEPPQWHVKKVLGE